MDNIKHKNAWLCWKFLFVKQKSFLSTVTSVLLMMGDSNKVKTESNLPSYLPVVTWWDVTKLNWIEMFAPGVKQGGGSIMVWVIN